MSDENPKPKKDAAWRAWGTPEHLRTLRGYSSATAAKEKKPKRKPKLKLVKGGKR